MFTVQRCTHPQLPSTVYTSCVRRVLETKTRGEKAEGVRKDKIRVGVREIRELRQRLDTPTVEKAVYLPLLGATIDRLLAEVSLSQQGILMP